LASSLISSDLIRDEGSGAGVKASDYADFKKVAVLITKKDKLTTEKGINEIKLIKSNMNFQRGSV